MEQYLPYLNWIDHQQHHMKELVISLCNINSHTMNYKGLEEVLKELKKAFEVLKGEMKEVELAPRTIVDEHGKIVQVPLGKALHITKRPNAPIKMLFAGHMDTVYPKNSTFQHVVEQDGVRLLGPGVADMKGGLVVLLTALQAVEKSPYAANIGWEIIINPDEEIGSPGSSSLYKEAAQRNHLALLFEPAHADGAIVSSRAGSMKLTVIVRGRAAHAGRDFAKGRSALFAIAPLIVDLEKLNTLKPDGDEVQNFEDQVIVNCGELTAGSGHNVVPELAILRINVRANNPQLLSATKERIESLIKKHQVRDGIFMELHDDGINPPKMVDYGTEKMVEYLTHAAKELGIQLKTKPSRGASDGNLLSSCGLACIDTLGVIGANIHTHNEYMLIDSLVERAKLAALFILRVGAQEYQFDSTKSPIAL